MSNTHRMAVKSVTWWYILAAAAKLVYPTSRHLDSPFCAKNSRALLAAKVTGFGDLSVYRRIKMDFFALTKSHTPTVFTHYTWIVSF